MTYEGPKRGEDVLYGEVYSAPGRRLPSLAAVLTSQPPYFVRLAPQWCKAGTKRLFFCTVHGAFVYAQVPPLCGGWLRHASADAVFSAQLKRKWGVHLGTPTTA